MTAGVLGLRYKNLQAFRCHLRDIISTSKDTEKVRVSLGFNCKTSVGTKFYTCTDFTEDQRIDDLMGIMAGGTETTAHSLLSCLYYLKKYPNTLQKLKEELHKEGFRKDVDYEKQYTVENIQNCSYLNCIVKETFRRDASVPDTFDYCSIEDTEICGVPIAKGIKVKLDLVSNLFADDQWLEPLEFVPERHDIESDFYKKSRNAGKIQNSYSRRIFSHGRRNCAGQSLANMEMKMIIAYLVTHMEFTFDKKDLETEGIGFGIASQFNPKITVTKL